MKITTDISITSRRRRAVSEWSPVQLFAQGGVGGWYDASVTGCLWQDVAGTVPATEGTPVARIDDLSGNGYHCIQPTLAARPTFVIDPQGRPCLEFDGVDDLLQAPFALDHRDATLALGFLTTVSDENGGVPFGVGTHSTGRFYLQTSFGNTRFLRQPQNGASLSVFGTPADIRQVALARIGPGPDSFLARSNGAAIDWAGSNAQQMSLAGRHIQIGARLPGSGHSAMRFYAGLYLMQALSDAALEQTEAFLAQKLGVVLP